MSRAARFALAFAAVALGAGTASAVVWRADKPPEDAFALAKFGGAVGRVDRGGLATLIARDWALTAAHVAHGLTEANRIRWGDRDYAVKRVVIHPQGMPDPARPRTPPEVDLALIQLAIPVDGVTPVLPNRGRDEAGERLVIAGFGDHGPAGGPFAPGDGKLRAVENQVDDAGPLRLFLRFDAPPAGLPLEGIGGPGDSGGPLLALGPDSVRAVVGVSSGADGPPGQYGTTDVYARVSTQIEWIEQVAGQFRELAPIERPAPRYPSRAMRKGLQGDLVVDLVIDAEGKVEDVIVVESTPPELNDERTLATLKRWRFEPRIEAGVRVPRTARQRLQFRFGPDPADDPNALDDLDRVQLMRKQRIP